MTYTPVLPLSGYAGWSLLSRTMPAQTAAFNKSPEIVRDVDYFRAKIGTVKTADQLVGDRRLLKVALGAFGLDSDIDNKAFIQKVLSDGTQSATALSSRLADKRYQQFAAAFGFDQAQPATQSADFANTVVTAYQNREFETAVGDQDVDLRLALNAQRELANIAANSSSETTKWLTILGSAPLSKVFQKALGLPATIGSLDLDQQLSVYQTKADAVFSSGDISQFTDSAKVNSLVKRFLTRSQADQMISQTSSPSIALTLLQQTASTLRRR
jgi:hypothetical protein